MRAAIFVTTLVVAIFAATGVALYYDLTSWEHTCAKRPWLDLSRGC